jgi:hypothetical protein
MTGFVVDASVAVKWLIDEPLSGQAARLLENDLPLVAPEVIYRRPALPQRGRQPSLSRRSGRHARYARLSRQPDCIAYNLPGR